MTDKPLSFKKAFSGPFLPALVAIACVSWALAVLASGLLFEVRAVRGDLKGAQEQLSQFQGQASCRSGLNTAVTDALNAVRNVDGAISITLAQLFQEALNPPLSDERKAWFVARFEEQIRSRTEFQAALENQIARQKQAEVLCPSAP